MKKGLDLTDQPISSLHPFVPYSKLEEKSRPEMRVGNLGLGAALAIAYDLYNEPVYPSPMTEYVLLSAQPQQQQLQSSMMTACGGNAGDSGEPPPNGWCVSALPDGQSRASVFSLARYPPASMPQSASYLSPIPTPGCAPTAPRASVAQGYAFLSQPPGEQQLIGCFGAQALGTPTSANNGPRNTPVSDLKSIQSASSSASSDDGSYEISEEELREIDASLTDNPEVTSSRHWKFYLETNEWTRATCALMACLFSRDQMANSTVLGRGGSQRERLPTNLVAYVVTKVRRRFNKPAAAVRARMAQKCKDERRFGRVLPTGEAIGPIRNVTRRRVGGGSRGQAKAPTPHISTAPNEASPENTRPLPPWACEQQPIVAPNPAFSPSEGDVSRAPLEAGSMPC